MANVGTTHGVDTPNTHKHENSSRISISMGEETRDHPETSHDSRIVMTIIDDDYTSSTEFCSMDGEIIHVPAYLLPNPDSVHGTDHEADAMKVAGERANTTSTSDGMFPDEMKSHIAVTSLHWVNNGG